MRKFIVIILLRLSILPLSAQVGINTTKPQSTLEVNGSFSAKYTEVTTKTYNILPTDYYITYNGTKDAIFTLSNTETRTKNSTGRIYKIKNVSPKNITLQTSNNNTLRKDKNAVNSIRIPAGGYAEVVKNGNTSGTTWEVFSAGSVPNNIEIYETELFIPPHAFDKTSNVKDWTQHANANYDSGKPNDRWWVISKSSINYEHTYKYNKASRMVLVYEYQGKPFNIDNIRPIFTIGNKNGSVDVFAASFIKLANNGTNGKTRLTIAVARVDFIGNSDEHKSNWAGTFSLNVMLIKKPN